MRQDNTQKDSLGGCEEGGTVDGGGKMMQERKADADGAKVTTKIQVKKLSNVDENKVDKKREVEKPCTVAINNSPSVYLVHMDNLTAGKDSGTSASGVLVTQERMTDDDTAKVDTNAKSDGPDTYDTSDASKIDTPNIYVKIGIGKPWVVAITIS